MKSAERWCIVEHKCGLTATYGSPDSHVPLSVTRTFIKQIRIKLQRPS